MDVFFVISGYLISSVILTEMAAGRFSIVNFYERRVRRIFPRYWSCCSAHPAAYAASSRPRSRPSPDPCSPRSSRSRTSCSGIRPDTSTPPARSSRCSTPGRSRLKSILIFFPLFLVTVRRLLPGRLKAAIWTVTAVTFALACLSVRSHPHRCVLLRSPACLGAVCSVRSSAAGRRPPCDGRYNAISPRWPVCCWYWCRRCLHRRDAFFRGSRRFPPVSVLHS